MREKYGKFYADWYDESGARHTKALATKQEAKQPPGQSPAKVSHGHNFSRRHRAQTRMIRSRTRTPTATTPTAITSPPRVSR
jgi:hypothetical protein